MDSGSFIEAGKLGKMFSPHFVILIETWKNISNEHGVYLSIIYTAHAPRDSFVMFDQF
jgi:hypothetical protein